MIMQNEPKYQETPTDKICRKTRETVQQMAPHERQDLMNKGIAMINSNSPTEIKPAELKMKPAKEWRNEWICGNYGMIPFIEAIQQDAIRSVQPEEGLSDKDMLDWLSQCTAGQWDLLNNVRLATWKDNFRQAITAAIKKEREG